MGTNHTTIRQRKRHVGQMNGHEYKHSKHVSGSDSLTAILPRSYSYKYSCPELHCNRNLGTDLSQLRAPPKLTPELNGTCGLSPGQPLRGSFPLQLVSEPVKLPRAKRRFEKT